MRRIAHSVGILLCLLLLSACAVTETTKIVNPAQSDERLLSDVRMQYRNASLIVDGVCSGSYLDANGNNIYDLIVENVYAGTASPGDKLHCPAVMTEGERYVLFLGAGENVHYAEDEISYALLTEAPLKMIDNEILFGGKRLARSIFEEEIEQMHNVISAPAPVYYYDSLEELVQAADEVFIGQVVEIPAYNALHFDIRSGGSMEKALYNASAVTVQVLGSIKGKLGGSYGMQIDLIHSPEFALNMLDETTMKPSGFLTGDMPALKENDMYLFFLREGPDDKQAYYFMVNPLQGIVGVDDEYLRAPPKNRPMLPYNTLKAAVEEMRKILNYDTYINHYEDETPVLVIEE